MSGLQATAERIKALFADMNRLPKRHAETTIFNIGGRGYYENATSDVLAFFLDPSREHGFKTAILESLLSAAGINGSDFEPLNRPEREYPSSGGNRIDILVEGKNHVLVIENKIRHAAVNPFEDYEQTIRDKFRGKKALLVLLTYRDEQVPGWSTARYQIVVNHLRERMGHLLMDRAYTKWPLLLREFVLTLEEEMADEELEQALLEFGTKNAAPLFEARDLLNKFVNQVAEQALSVVAAECGVAINKCATRFHSWSDGQAIRLLVPARWGGNTNITLLVMSAGGFRCQIYAYGFPQSEHEHVETLIKIGTMRFWKESGSSICCSGDLSSQLPDVRQAFELVKICAQRLNLLHPLPAGINDSAKEP